MFLLVSIIHVMLPLMVHSLSLSITALLIPFIPTLCYTPMKLSIVCNFGSFSIIYHQDTECHVLSIHVVPPSAITLISFDSVINYLAIVLHRQGYNDLQHLIC